MKLIIVQTILIFAVITITLAAPHSANDVNLNEADLFNPNAKHSLESWFDELSQKIENSPIGSGIYKFLKNTDKNCIKQKLKMTENGNKVINLAQAVVTTTVANLKCYDKSENTAVFELVNVFLEHYESTNFEKYGDCYFKTLQKLEPTSKFVENFHADQMELTKDECDRHLGEDTYDATMENFESYTGDLMTFTCGNFNADIFKTLGMKVVILSHEKNEELKESEVEKLRDFIGTKLDKIFNCVMENM